MPILTKEQFESLAKFNNNPCVSIFIPTERAGKEVLQEESKLRLKSEWKKVSERLKAMNLGQEKIDKLGKPVEDLLGDKDFWRHQSDGLAIFLADGFFENHTLPVNFETFSYVADHFYIKPLVPMLNRDSRFYLLALQLDKVKLYEATQYSIGEVKVDDLVPSQLEDRVGYDYEDKDRKHKTQNNLAGSSTVHGYSPATWDRKNEILRFFRAVDKGIYKVLNDEKVPLVVACQDSYFPIYKEASRYKHLYQQVVPGNPEADYDNMFELHAGALEVLEPHLRKQLDEKVEQFNNLNPERTSSSPSDIFPAIYEGKVDTLFLQNREDLWGNYNEKMSSVQIDDESTSANLSLMNLAATKVIEQGGKVYLLEKEFMPSKESKMNAVYRY